MFSTSDSTYYLVLEMREFGVDKKKRDSFGGEKEVP